MILPSTFWSTFWPYFLGGVLLLLGLVVVSRSGSLGTTFLERVEAFGPLLLAAPMGVFGAEHYVFTSVIAAMVPSWLPAHVFWAYLTGTALIAAAFAITLRRRAPLAAALLGVMIFSFASLIGLPAVVESAGDRFRLAVLLRDLSFSGMALALSMTLGFKPLQNHAQTLRGVLRYWIGVPWIAFGIEHLLHPDFVPVVPLAHPMLTGIPGHTAIVYAVGLALIGCGVCLVLDWNAALAAGWLGAGVLAVIVVVYVPLLVGEPSVGVGLNYFADTLAFGGGILVVARALRGQSAPAV
jgi:uncharacterized membrane protein